MSRKLEVEIVGDSKSLEKAFGKASKSTSNFGSSLKTLGKTAAIGIGAVAVAGGVLGKKMVSLASDAAEVESKFKVIFGKEMPGMVKNIDAFSRATGASRYELREQVADMGALLEPLTKTKKEAGEMSIQFTKLATDLGSFNNVPTADALLAIRSGLVGEAEPLRRFGVLLNEAAVKQEALRLGLVKGKEELTEQQKVQARASLIMKQTTLAQGDATRTAGSFANQIKMLKNSLLDMGTDIGKVLLPHILNLVKFINAHMPQIQAVIETTFKAIVTVIDSAVESIKKVVGFFQTIKDKATEIWPEIARVIGVSLGDIDDDLNVTRRGLSDFQVAHDSFWDKIKAREQQAKAWYQGEFAPALKNVLKALQLAWQTFGDEIIKITKSIAVKIAQPIKELMNVLGVQIRTGLAILRGDWRKALDQIRDAVVERFGGIISFMKSIPGKIKNAFSNPGDLLRSIGSAIMGGFLGGLREKWETVKSFISGIAGWIQDHKGPEEEDRRLLYQAGALIMQGLGDGLNFGFGKVQSLIDGMSPDLQSKMGKVVDGIVSAIQDRKSALGEAFSELVSNALSAFDVLTDKFQTKTEKKMAAQDEQRANADRQNALNQAREDIATATASGDADALKAAKEAEADALFAIQRAKDEKLAEQERKSYENRRGLRRRHFEEELAELQRKLDSGQIKTAEAQEKFLKLLKKYKVPFREAGGMLGLALAEGLTDAFADVKKAGKQMAEAIKEGIERLKFVVNVQIQNASASNGNNGAPGRARGGPVRAGSPYMVGEAGPELFVPKQSGNIIPNGAGGGTIEITNNTYLDGKLIFTEIQKQSIRFQKSNATPAFQT